jgi:hypothetical protein
MRPVALACLLVLAACGGDSEDAAPADWCHATSRVVYLLDQHSTTLTYDELGDWEESSPDEIEARVADATAVLRRYPVDADAPGLVAARAEIEQFAQDGCGEDWKLLYRRPPPA